MAVSSENNQNGITWRDEIGLLPLFLTLILPIVIGVIVLIKCVYNHCCLRKTSTKSYTVKPTLKSWKKGTEEGDGDAIQEHGNAALTEENHNQGNTSTSGSVTNSLVNPNPSDRVIPIEGEEEAPVPPRRTGSSQWRRNNPPQEQAQINSTNDNQVNFSGDSQDSRGYTRITVREPLSNIRNQAIRRNVDSHYATVSDDSEEMYAAIEDGSDANYMQIPGDDPRHWQERREANSPLPPVPPPISPVLMPSSETLISVAQNSDPLPPLQPPIYAQVTKTKKSKAPIPPTPSLSNSSASSSHTTALLPLPPEQPSDVPPPAPPTSKKRSHLHTSVILDPPDVPSESRRWSKADISYSEFEVVREPPFSSTKSSGLTVELIDEDNYNLIPDVRTRTSSRVSRHSDNPASTSTMTSRTLPHHRVSSSEHHPYSELKKPNTSSHSEEPNHDKNHGYAVVKKRNSIAEDSDPHNPYAEIKKRRSTSRSPTTGYYQEIGETKSAPIKKRDNLYQKIRRKGVGGDESDEEDEDEEDQFYEKVKTKPSSLQRQGTSGNSSSGGLPEKSNPSALKHGYEKIKPKTKEAATSNNSQPPPPPVIESDEDGSSLYEQVKYPPYERLKESRDTLLEDGETEGGRDNLYEDIGYSRITKSSTSKSSQSHGASSAAGAPVSIATVSPPSPVDLDNLYARVDMTKKKRKAQKKEHRIEYF